MQLAHRFAATLAVALLPFGSAQAQQPAPPPHPITADAYDGWKTIANPALTPDGRWAVYTLTPQVGEGSLVARSTNGETEYRASRGYIARPNLLPGHFARSTTPPPAITGDSRWVVFTVEPSRGDVERARRAKAKPDRQPTSSLGILDLTTGQVTLLPRVRSFKVPRLRGAYVAYVLEPDSTARRDSVAPVGTSTATPPGDSARAKRPGLPLVLRDLGSGREVRIPDVAAYAFPDSGGALAYAVSTKSGTGDGVYVRALREELVEEPTTTLVSGPGRYQSLTFDAAGRQLAFLSDREEYPAPKARFALYYATISGGPAKAVVTRDSLRAGMVVAPEGTVQFSRHGQALLFGVGPDPIDSLPADSLTERAVFDLWHYKDPDLQPAQRLQAGAARAPWYTAVYWPGSERWVRLGNDSVAEIRLSEDARTGSAVSIFPYRIQGMWGRASYDVYLVDATTGQWTLVRRALPSTGGDAPTGGRAVYTRDVDFSPGGRFVLLFDHGQWLSYDATTRRQVSLTSGIRGIRFDNEVDDHPATKNPWGVVGWTTGDASVLVRDRFDIWQLDPTGRQPPRNLTAGVGRARRITFRPVKLDREDPYVSASGPLLLAAVDDESRDEGFWTAALDGAKPLEKVLMIPKRLTLVAKAANADQLLATEQTYEEFPDLWTGTRLTALARISDANPQQKQYSWGSNQLIRFTSTSGQSQKAVLYKPDGFDPRKKYPLLVYIYERLSDELHAYKAPQPNSANITPTTYASKGYLVVEPDIAYTVGHPGESALASVVPVVRSLIDSGFVDPKRVGLQGHSWGGYQAAYIVTRTNIFRAVSAGAPVVNMTSAYGGIRWGSGASRAWQYEQHQSRIGATPWDRPDLYLENSPLFHLPNVHTPLLVMHDDADGAVPWYQGIELFIGLRRLGREVYLFDYNNDDHGTTKRANALDWDMRVQQFFDHYLMDAGLPEWMDKGIPYVRKGRDQAPAALAETRLP